MKQLFKVIAIIFIISSLICQTTALASGDVENNILQIPKDEASEQWLWETLNQYIDNPKIAAGILAYFWRESFYRSDAVAGYYYYGEEYGNNLCQEFTQKIDNGFIDSISKDHFVYACSTQYGGFGLGQWQSVLYADKLYDFAQEWGTSIADAEMQCAFTIQSIKEHPTELWDLIKDEENVWLIGRYIGIYYDGSILGAEMMAPKAEELWKKYGTDI